MNKVKLINLHYLVYYRNERGVQIANWHESLEDAVKFARYCKANDIPVDRIEEKRIVKDWEE